MATKLVEEACVRMPQVEATTRVNTIAVTDGSRLASMPAAHTASTHSTKLRRPSSAIARPSHNEASEPTR
jgi:hypothetical protein